jgi:hypothetical protein
MDIKIRVYDHLEKGILTHQNKPISHYNSNNRFSLMLALGFSDKDDKEIYGQDILMHRDGRLSTLFWDDKRPGWLIRGKNCNRSILDGQILGTKIVSNTHAMRDINGEVERVKELSKQTAKDYE